MSGPQDAPENGRIIGRYALFDEIAAGGMATVHIGRLRNGVASPVAIKRLHPQFAKDPEFVAMFLDEAHLVSRIEHVNVIRTVDVIEHFGEVFLVMEYVHGETLFRLVHRAQRENESMPLGHAVSMMSGVLRGLHAAHEAKSECGQPLNIVHRDVSPQNIFIGIDGVSRLLDFGVAKATMRAHATGDRKVKGKLGYMSPEQLNGMAADRRSDVFSAGVVLWEVLCGRRLFEGVDAGEVIGKVLSVKVAEPKSVVSTIPDSLNKVVMRALARERRKRFQSAHEFALALENAAPMSTLLEMGQWVQLFGGDELDRRADLVDRVAGTQLGGSGLRAIETSMDISPGDISAPMLPSEPSNPSEVGVRHSHARPIPALAPPPMPRGALVPAPVRVGVAPKSATKSRPPPLPFADIPTVEAERVTLVRRPSSGRTALWAVLACVAGGLLGYYVFHARTPVERVRTSALSSTVQQPAAPRPEKKSDHP